MTAKHDTDREVIQGKPPGLHYVSRKFAIGAIPHMMETLKTRSKAATRTRNCELERERLNSINALKWRGVFDSMNRRGRIHG